MRKISPPVAATVMAATLSLFSVAAALLPAGAQARLAYPPAARGDVVDDYFGTKVPDPYRWMEAIDAPETRTWLEAEAALTESYLAAIPARQTLRDRLRTLYDYERVSAPAHRGTTYVFTKNSGLQNQSVYYVSDGENGPRRVLLDPNALSSDGTVSIGGSSLSNDGKLWAYSTQTAGSDWQTWHVRDIATGKDRPDVVERAKFSGASWTHDNRGFYYSGYDVAAGATSLNIVNANQKVRYHRLGTDASTDRLVYERPDHPDWFLNVGETEDGVYTIYHVSKGHTNGILYRRTAAAQTTLTSLFPNGKASYSIVDNDGPVFYVYTNDGAPNGKLVAVDLRNPHAPHTIVPESRIALEGVNAVGGFFFGHYLKDAHVQEIEFDRSGKRVREIALPGIGNAAGFFGRRGDRATYYTYASFAQPTEIFRLDLASGKSTAWYRPAAKFDPSRYLTEQIFFNSKDGTRVPMFVTHRKGMPLDGSTPTLLTGYGGFEIPSLPNFSPVTAEWLEMGGTYVLCNMRGGSEYGEAWHVGGMLGNKQHVFDDFIAAAEWLVAHKYTSTPKLAIRGGSNGGLLMGAVENQRPDLFGAVLADVGVMDMLRFQKFTVGAAWIPEYGSSEASADQFKTLYAYSPYHNLRPGTKYPPTLIQTADHDDRVFPAHSFKYAAEMQRDQAGDAPILLFVQLRAGHGGGKPLEKVINENADKYAFLTKALNFTPFGP